MAFVRHNPEKQKFKEEWGDKHHPITNLTNIPKPFRCLIVGIVSSGKSSSVLRILLDSDPKWEYIFILHPHYVNYTVSAADEEKNIGILVDQESKNFEEIEEYKGIEFAGILRYIPTENFFKNVKNRRTCLIIDDIELKSFCNSARRREKLNKLYSYVSSHFNISIITTSQDPTSQIPQMIGKFANFYIIHKLKNFYQMLYVSEVVGLPLSAIQRIAEICKNIHDSIWYDFSFETPAKYRLNGNRVLPEEIEKYAPSRVLWGRRLNADIDELLHASGF
jgi:hypothetical protein